MIIVCDLVLSIDFFDVICGLGQVDDRNFLRSALDHYAVPVMAVADLD